MNQSSIGQTIAQKRKAKNMTQSQLAEKLNISNKAISKWENGKCMPDYSIIEQLCSELDITLNELISGKTEPETNNEKQLLDLFRKIQELEKQKNMMLGLFLIVMGIALMALSHTFSGSDVQNFLSGALLGISVGEMLVGVYCIVQTYIQ